LGWFDSGRDLTDLDMDFAPWMRRKTQKLSHPFTVPFGNTNRVAKQDVKIRH